LDVEKRSRKNYPGGKAPIGGLTMWTEKISIKKHDQKKLKGRQRWGRWRLGGALHLD